MSELTVDPTALLPGDKVVGVEPGGLLRVSRDTRNLCPGCRASGLMGAHTYHNRVADPPCECRQTSCKYTTTQLTRAIKAVQNKENWKYPISATLTDQQMADLGGPALIAEAISYYTGSPVEIYPDDQPGHMRVEAAGYYACIGS